MNIYVGNLSHSVDEETLRSRFEEFGEVTAVKIIKDRFTGSPRGFAFVEMPVEADALRAISELNGQDLNGRAMTVNEARPQEPRPAGGNRFGGSNGGGHRSPAGDRGGFNRKPGQGNGGGWGRGGR